MTAVTPVEAPVEQTGRRWTFARWTIFAAFASASIFVLPQFVAVPPSISTSYIFGYSNRTGVLLLAGFLIVAAIYSNGLRIEFRPPVIVGRIPKQTLWIWMVTFAAAGSGMYFLDRGLHGLGESRYFIDRLTMLTAAKRPFSDFEFAYGPLLLYGPRLLMTLHLNLEQSYFGFWLISQIVGVWMLYQILEMLDYPSEHKVAIFNLFCLFGFTAIVSTGLNYTLCRFLSASYFGLVVQRIDGRGGRCQRAVAMLLSVGFTIALLAISPELSLAYAVGTLGYFATFGKWDWRSVTLYVGLLGAEAAIAFCANFLNVFVTLKALAGGAYNFPIIPAGHILFFFFACGLVALFVGRRLREGSRGDGTLMVVAVSAGTLPAALGRCDIGHVGFGAIGILLVASMLASNFPRLWKSYLIAFVVLFIFVPSVLELASFPFAFTKRKALINEAGGLDQCPALSSINGTLLAPFGFSPNCERGFRSGAINPGYFFGLVDMLTPAAVDRKISEMRDRPMQGLLLPENFDAQCEIDAEGERSVIRVLFVYPYHGRVRNEVRVAEPLCAYIHTNYRKTESLGKEGHAYAIWNPF